MIVRILGEGQYDVPDDALDALNQLDEAIMSAVEAGDEQRFSSALAGLLEGVRAAGRPHAVSDLVPSDLVLPREGASLGEVRALLGGEGLVPG